MKNIINIEQKKINNNFLLFNIDNNDSKKKIKKNIKKNINKTTWTEKYRPLVLRHIIGHDNIKKTLINSIKKGNLPHLLFYGNSGTGKTTTALALVMQLYGPKMINNKVLELNASDENGINVVRDKIIKFSNIVVGSKDPIYPSPDFKIIILDEVDSMTSEAQTALKKVMEVTCNITRFVFICNYENKIIEAIKSRCAEFRFDPLPVKLIENKLKEISQNEKMDIGDDIIKLIPYICNGDVRKSINILQNIKYIPWYGKKKIIEDDIYNIVSYVKDTYFDKYWNTILNGNINQLKDITLEISNEGYSINYLLNCIQNKLLKTNISEKKKSRILINLSKTERIVSYGADDYIQLLAVFVYINYIYNNKEIQDIKVY